MIPVGKEPATLSPTRQVKAQSQDAQSSPSSAPLKIEHNKVTLSDEGKALLAALQEIEKTQRLLISTIKRSVIKLNHSPTVHWVWTIQTK